MSSPEPQLATVSYHKVKMEIESETETPHLVGVSWWPEEISLKIKPILQFLVSQFRVSMRPIRKKKPNLVDIQKELHLPGLPALDQGLLMDSFKILIWNCRGAGNNRFKQHFSELMRQHKPDVVALLETKVCIQSMGFFFRNLGFTRDTFTDPNGRSGGIWVLWDPSKVSVFTIAVTNQVIHVKIQRNGYADWVFSAIYASPNPRLRDIFWEGLKEYASTNNLLWCAAGDYNEIASLEETRSSAPDNSHGQRRKFMENINTCNLVDLGAAGPKFTWNNGRQGSANMQKRLDRGLCNEEWRSLFPEDELV